MLSWHRTGWRLWSDDGGVDDAPAGEVHWLVESAADAGDHVYLECGWREVLRDGDARWWEVAFHRDRPAWLRLREPGAGPANRWRTPYASPKLIPFHFELAHSRSTVQKAVALFTWAEWVRSHGVEPGSKVATALALWRSCLGVTQRFNADVGRQSFYGGRKESPYVGALSNVGHWDLAAAYPAAMVGWMPGSLEDTGLRHRPAAGEIGVVRATVDIPESDWPPLPIQWRPRYRGEEARQDVRAYGWGQVTGWWPWGELETAMELGGVKLRSLHKVYVGRGLRKIGERWWDEVVGEGRGLSHPGAAKLAKATLNVTWSAFAMGGAEHRRVSWTDRGGGRPEVRRTTRPDLGGVFVSAEVASRVRRRLYSDALVPLGPLVAHCDTDGILGPSRWPGAPAGWRLKERHREVEIRGPQTYRYRCGFCGVAHPDWHYVVAGADSHERAAAIFGDTRPSPGTPLSRVAPYDNVVCVPPGPVGVVTDARNNPTEREPDLDLRRMT